MPQISHITNETIKEVGATLVKYWYVLLLLVYISSIPQKAQAACQPIYNGGPTCSDASLTIENKVFNSSINKFVHDLSASDATFQAQDLVTFQITLTNTSNKPLEKVIVKNSFPSVLTFASGPGTFDKSSKILTFEVNNIAAHHAQVFTVSGKIDSQDIISSVQNSCMSNHVSALPSSGSIVEDTSGFCLTTLTSTPATGPEAFAWLTLLPMGLAGIVIKSRK